MTTPLDNRPQLERLADNVWAKIGTRFLLPVLVAVVGWFVVDKLGSIQDSQKEGYVSLANAQERLTQSQAKIAEIQNNLTTTVRVLTETVTNNRQRSDENITRLDHELQRLNRRVNEQR